MRISHRGAFEDLEKIPFKFLALLLNEVEKMLSYFIFLAVWVAAILFFERDKSRPNRHRGR